MPVNKKQLVCFCNHVTAPEIIKVLRNGADTTDEIKKFTAAGTGCGRCLNEIDSMVKKYSSDIKQDAQLRLRFE